MSGHAEIEIIGNVGKEPRLYETQNNLIVANFSVAVNESYKKTDGEKEVTTTWYRVSAWNGLSKVATDFINQGRKVFIKGYPKADFFVDKKGVIRPIINIRATKIRLLDSSYEEQEEVVTDHPEEVSEASELSEGSLGVVDDTFNAVPETENVLLDDTFDVAAEGNNGCFSNTPNRRLETNVDLKSGNSLVSTPMYTTQTSSPKTRSKAR